MKTAELLKDIMITYLANNKVPPEKLPKLIENVTTVLDDQQNQDRQVNHRRISRKRTSQERKTIQKIQTKKLGRPKKIKHAKMNGTKKILSNKDSHVTCLVCQKNFSSLRRHLNETHNMTPAQYRTQYNLEPDYPMVAPAVVKRMSVARKKVLAEKKKK